jgi:hypothetical protein
MEGPRNKKMARFNTRPLEQSGDGGAKENKKWSGSIPDHWNKVEMEGPKK